MNPYQPPEEANQSEPPNPRARDMLLRRLCYSLMLGGFLCAACGVPAAVQSREGLALLVVGFAVAAVASMGLLVAVALQGTGGDD